MYLSMYVHRLVDYAGLFSVTTQLRGNDDDLELKWFVLISVI